MSEIAVTLQERGKHYEGRGGYEDTAKTCQNIKAAIRGGANWGTPDLTPAMCESLEMISAKIARIVNGNPRHIDSWHDIAGYATLIEKLIDG